MDSLDLLAIIFSKLDIPSAHNFMLVCCRFNKATKHNIAIHNDYIRRFHVDKVERTHKIDDLIDSNWLNMMLKLDGSAPLKYSN